MKKIMVVFLPSLLFSCDNGAADRNPYLPEANFSFSINLNLPLYSGLKTPGNSIYIGNAGVGVRGVFVTNNGTSFFAWEASCPNHVPSDCSTMTITGGINCRCACENYTYSLFTGAITGEEQPEGQAYSLLNYRTSFSGDVVVVSN
ncbi:MAG: hypothetical protein KDD04_09535 [Sinomicrobium sp.]|nr:hypothetical protein [Sinomicrobium sp.]